MKILWVLLSCSLLTAQASLSPLHKVNYKTHFGNCPQKTTAQLTMDLVRLFEEKESLKSLKDKIVEENLKDKYFISHYQVNYNPILKDLSFYYECPRALLKVQIFKPDGNEHYNAVLVEDGRLLDPIYEVTLRSENLIQQQLPFLAVKVDQINDDLQNRIAVLFNLFPESIQGNLAEIIIGDNEEMTLILSLQDQTVSVFLGENQWSDKIPKLTRVISYMLDRNKVPAIINMTNLKKVIVKFSRNL